MTCFRLIDAEKAQHRVSQLCEVLGIDPSTLYRKLSRYEEQVEVKA